MFGVQNEANLIYRNNEVRYKVANKVVSIVANCEDCSWHDEDYDDARSKAREHSRKTGHTTNVDETKVYTYQRGVLSG